MGLCSWWGGLVHAFEPGELDAWWAKAKVFERGILMRSLAHIALLRLVRLERLVRLLLLLILR